MVKKKFELTKEEYLEFTNRLMVKSKIKIVIITGLIVFVGVVLFTFKDGVMEAFTTATMLFVAYFLIVFIGLHIFAPLFAKRAYEKNNIKQVKFDYELLDTGIKQGKNTFLFEYFNKVVEGKYSFFLYLKDKQVVVLPKRVFDDTELESFRNKIKQQIKNTKLKK